MSRKDWLGADIDGLAKLIEHRGKAFAIEELTQNAWDEKVKKVTIAVELIEGRRAARIRVEDDSPDGYSDITHAFILFAESKKKSDPMKRGRYNLGEKLVLSLCEEATISTTTGTIVFDAKGRHRKNLKRAAGSVFEGIIKMTKAEYEEVCTRVQHLIPPEGIETTFNGLPLVHRKPLKTFEAKLPTVIADGEGSLSRTVRQTVVSVYEPLPGETPSIYELGIPVVETGDKWHVDIGQKVPLNMDRDNVTPAYLRQIRTLVVNEMVDHIKGDDAAASWTKNALEDENIKPEVVVKLLDEMFPGEKVIFDPSDLEANKAAVAAGATPLTGRMFSGPTWKNIHKTEAFKPAGQVYTTSRVVFSNSPDAKQLKIIAPEDYPEGMKRIVKFATIVAKETLAIDINVEVCASVEIGKAAFYGSRTFTFNVGRLGYEWFKQKATSEPVTKLVIHELVHEIEANHLDERYHEGLCTLGARLMRLALEKPALFREFNRDTQGSVS